MKISWLKKNKYSFALQKPCVFSSNKCFSLHLAVLVVGVSRDLLNLSVVATALLSLQSGSIGSAVTVMLRTNSEV